MNVGLIISGLVFLFMPNFNIIDILPDFIGCALIMKGISKVQLVNLSLTESYEAFRKLLIVGLCKIPAMGIYGLINVDGDTYCFMGLQPKAKPLTQTSLKITAFSTDLDTI